MKISNNIDARTSEGRKLIKIASKKKKKLNVQRNLTAIEKAKPKKNSNKVVRFVQQQTN
jgi:hypothetical protein